MTKNKNLAKTCHMILMGLMIILSCVSAGIIFSGNIPEGFEVNAVEAHKNASLVIGIGHVVNAFALVCGLTYMIKGSGKNVAGLYKSFLFLVTIGLIARLIGKLIYPGFDAVAVLTIIGICALLILTFVKDLGRTKTWSAFYVLLAVDVAIAILMFDKREALSSIASGLTRLVIDGTIGIAIRAKYEDKALRGK